MSSSVPLNWYGILLIVGGRLFLKEIAHGPEPEPAEQPQAPSGGDGCRVLARLPEHELWLPLGERGLHCGEHRRGAQPTEQFTFRNDCSHRLGRGRDCVADVRYLLCRWLFAHSDPVAALCDSCLERGRDDNEHVVTAVAERVDDWAQRVEVACASERTGNEDSHSRDAKPHEGCVVQPGGDSALCICRDATW